LTCEVDERLKKRDVAHFRFVDDHVFLAYSFEDLVSWVDEYLALLDASETAQRSNPDKIEPEGVWRHSFRPDGNLENDSRPTLTAAAKACKLNPQFPTPLMTKLSR